MGKSYVGVSNVAKEVKNIYVGVNGVAKEVKNAYVGVNGVAREIYSSIIKGKTTIIVGSGTMNNWIENSGTVIANSNSDMQYIITIDNGNITYNKTQINWFTNYPAYIAESSWLYMQPSGTTGYVYGINNTNTAPFSCSITVNYYQEIKQSWQSIVGSNSTYVSYTVTYNGTKITTSVRNPFNTQMACYGGGGDTRYFYAYSKISCNFRYT